MGLAVHTHSRVREHSFDSSESPPRRRSSLHARSPCRNPSRRGFSPERCGGSSPKVKSPTRNKSSQKGRSSTRQESLKHAKHSLKSGSFSQSPSPHTKRLRPPPEDVEGASDKDRERNNSGRKESERKGSFIVDEDIAHEKGPSNDKYNHSSRSRHESSLSRGEHNRKHNNHGSQSPRKNGSGASHGEHHHRHSGYRSRSPRRIDSAQERKHATRSGERDEASYPKRSAISRDDDHDSVSKMKAAEDALEAKQKQKPSFELSGKLAEETNRVRGITLLFTEPPDAQKPDMRWRLYVFKAGEVLNDPLYVHRQSCYLFGRERRVADIPTDHPSCSKQHAVIQFRLVEKEGDDGLMKKQVRPYLMDLGSTNGTFLNDNQLEPQRYYELFEKDTIKFGNSSREYVLLHENSAS